MKNVKRLLTLILLVIFVSCGDDKKEEEKIKVGDNNSSIEVPVTTNKENTIDTSSAVMDSQQSQDGMVEVILTGNDQMKFNLKEIKVKAGQKVKLTLKHVGKLDKSAMGHNFVLLKQGTDLPQFAEKALAAKANEYIPQGSDKVIAHTNMIGGGEETSVEFTAPSAGTYDFICSFPGHYIQMQGKFIVE